MPPLATPERVARAVIGSRSGVRRPAVAYALAPGLTRGAIMLRTGRDYLAEPGTAPQTTGTLYVPSGPSGSGPRTGLRQGPALVGAGCAAAFAVRTAVRGRLPE